MIRKRLAACLFVGGLALLGSGCNGTGGPVLNGNGFLSRLNPFNRLCRPTVAAECCDAVAAPDCCTGEPVQSFGGPTFDGPALDPLTDGHVPPPGAVAPPGGTPAAPPVVNGTPRFNPPPQSHPMPYTP